jgi:hypothetical protein
MVRRPLGLVVGAAVVAVVTACQPATVSVAYTPAIGQRYGYRYEIDATVTRRVAGQAPDVEHLDAQLVAQERVQAHSRAGTRLRLVLVRDGGTPRSAVVLVDRAGSLAGIELVQGLDATTFGLAGRGSFGPGTATAPPNGRLAPGDRWTIRGEGRRGHGRLERLGVVDGQDVAVMATAVTEQVDEAGQAGTSATHVKGQVTSDATTSYDLQGGAVRRSRSHSTGTLRALLRPPSGVDASAVQATLEYDVTVRVTRTS